MPKAITVLSLIFLVSFLAVGCLGGSSSITTTNSSTQTGAPTPITFQVSGTEFAFTPSHLSVTAGQQVTVVFSNNGALAHTFTIPDLGVNTGSVGSGQQKTVTFTAPAIAGSHEFLCIVPGHSDRGMTGTITIS